jgi:hypothetical protein
MGSSEHDALDCDCAEEWGKRISSRKKEEKIPIIGVTAS